MGQAAEIIINYGSVKEAQKEVAKLRTDIQSLSSIRGKGAGGAGGGAAATPMGQMAKDAKVLGETAPAALGKVEAKLQHVASASYFATHGITQMARSFMHMFGPLAAIGAGVSIVQSFMDSSRKDSEGLASQGGKELKTAATSRLSAAAKDRLRSEFREKLGPGQIEDVLAKHGQNEAVARRALRTAAAGGEGLMPGLKTMEARRTEALTTSEAARAEWRATRLKNLGEEAANIRAELKQGQREHGLQWAFEGEAHVKQTRLEQLENRIYEMGMNKKFEGIDAVPVKVQNPHDNKEGQR